MKKAIVLGAAMLLAGAAAFAADVKFSGRIRVGYSFQFGDTDQTTLKKNPEGRMNLTIADPDSLWTITFDAAQKVSLDFDKKKANNDGETAGFSDHYYRAKATIALDKALKGAGVDLGDVSLKAFGGYYDFYETKNAYNDNPYSDNDVDRMDLNVATQSAEASIVGATVGYGKLVSVEAVSAPVSDSGVGTAFAFTATSTPVDGVQVGAGYGHNVRLSKGWASLTYNDALSVSANADIAKLIKNDKFSLGAAGEFLYGFEDSDDNLDAFFQVLGRVNGGVEKVDGYVEYGFAKVDADGADPLHYMRAQANLNLVKGLGLDVYYQDKDLTNEKKEDDFEIGAEAVYTFGGVDYHLDVAYVAKKDNDNFKITPWIQIAF
jgi:hypothetical protein